MCMQKDTGRHDPMAENFFSFNEMNLCLAVGLTDRDCQSYFKRSQLTIRIGVDEPDEAACSSNAADVSTVGYKRTSRMAHKPASNIYLMTGMTHH